MFKKLIFVFLFIIIVMSGLLKVDYSFNDMMKNKQRIEIVSVKIDEEKNYKIGLMGNSFTLNSDQLKSSLTNLKNKIYYVMDYIESKSQEINELGKKYLGSGY